MKALFLTILILCLPLANIRAEVLDSFPHRIEKTVEMTCDKKEPINSVLFSGRVRFRSREGVVRIILTDKDGARYLIAEVVAQYCEAKDTILQKEGVETTILPVNIVPSSVKFAISDAVVEIDELIFADKAIDDAERKSLFQMQDEKQKKREQLAVDYINAYNKTHDIYWSAKQNIWSDMSYAAKSSSLGLADDEISWGYEYYGSGIFIWGATDYNATTAESPSPYVCEFDWRNRHGQSWLTSIKNQEHPNILEKSGGHDSRCCWAFTAVAAVEARANLYFNQHLDLDLSEEYVIAYSRPSTPNYMYYGGQSSSALTFIKNNEVIDESSCQFGSHWNSAIDKSSINSLDSISICDFEIFSGSFTPDSLKKRLIQNGPLPTGLKTSSTQNHAMLLCGYHVIQAGDTVVRFDSNGIHSTAVIPDNSIYIGATCWVFKNSYGESMGHNGYYYAVIPDFNEIFKKVHCQFLIGPIISRNHTDADIVVEDKDGDGYYNWGIGPKPSGLPTFVPDDPDCDDSNPSIGSMDMFGFPCPVQHEASDTIYVWKDTEWSSSREIKCQIVVMDGATLHVTASATMMDNTHIYLKNGGKLIVDGVTIANARIVPQIGSELQIINGGTICTAANSGFVVPSGVNCNMRHGTVQ